MKIQESEIIELMSSEKTREKGVRQMMDAYQSRLYWHIRRIVVDHDLAQDTLQDTFLKHTRIFISLSKTVNYTLGFIGSQPTNLCNSWKNRKECKNRMKKPNITCKIWLQIMFLRRPKKFRFCCKKQFNPCRKSRNWCLQWDIMMICHTKKSRKFSTCRWEHWKRITTTRNKKLKITSKRITPNNLFDWIWKATF